MAELSGVAVVEDGLATLDGGLLCCVASGAEDAAPRFVCWPAFASVTD